MERALLPMEVTLSGKTISVMSEAWKALSPMEVTVSGKVILVNHEPTKERLAMLTTV